MKVKVVLRIIYLVLILLSIHGMEAKSQSSVFLNTSELEHPLILKGKVTAIHSPNHYYKDTTIVEYEHFIVIKNINDTINFQEIYKSEYRDSLLIDSFKFSYNKDKAALEYYNKTDFLNFSKMGKLLFLFHSENDSLSFPKRSYDNANDSLNCNVDTTYEISCFYQSILADYAESSSENMSFKKANNKYIINVNLEYKNEIKELKPNREYNYKSGRGSIHKIEWQATLDESKKYTSISKTEQIESLPFHRSKPNKIKSKITSNYSRLDSIPKFIQAGFD